MVERMKDLEKKEVIDIKSGCRLGYICDLEIELCEGKILSLIVPKGAGFMGWNKEEMVIPWQNIKKIGEDLIIVDTEQFCHK